MLKSLFPLIEPVLDAATGQEASRRFYEIATGWGATYLQTRLYRRPRGRLTPEAHWKAGGFVERIARPNWVGSAAFDYICFECNPLVRAIEEGRTRYRFGEFAVHDDPRYGQYWDAMSEADMAEVHSVTSYGADRKIATLHLGFGTRTVDPDLALVAQIAGQVLVERLMSFDVWAPDVEDPPVPPLLSRREHDSMAFVAEGKTDWEIAQILGIAETTARSHVDNARRKLGAVNRSHAVARFLAEGLLTA